MVCHRDLKPDNILIRSYYIYLFIYVGDNIIKIIDFSVSKFREKKQIPEHI